MICNAEGKMIDVGNNDEEGWDFYVLTPTQKAAMEENINPDIKHAIIFIAGSNQYYFKEDNEFSRAFTLNRCDHFLNRLFKLERDATQKVLKYAKNQRLIYRLTRETTRQSGQSHCFTPEYIFAQEFSNHYNEFAQYFPEFGRLRELSKAVALIGVIEQDRLNIIYLIERLKEFDKYYYDYSKASITNEKSEYLNKIKSDIGPVTVFKVGSLTTYCSKFEAYLPKLREAFAAELVNAYDPDYPIRTFLEGNTQPLLIRLVEYKQKQIYTQFKEKLFPNHTITTIGMAINGNVQTLNELLPVKIETQATVIVFKDEIAKYTKILAGFNKLGLDKKEPEVDLSKKCFWVPTSLNRDNKKLVYGGVRVNPQPLFLAQNSVQAQLLTNSAFTAQSQVRVSSLQITNAAPPSMSGGSAGGGGGSGGGSGRSNYNPLIEVLKTAVQNPKAPNQYEAVLSDGSKVLFRRDIGEHAHPLKKGKSQSDVDHYNVVLQVPSKNGLRERANLHIIVDKDLNPVNFYTTHKGGSSDINSHNKHRPK
jgi:hypothetical protein